LNAASYSGRSTTLPGSLSVKSTTFLLPRTDASALAAAGDRTTRQLVEAHIQPLGAEMLRCAPSHWARVSEMLLADQSLPFGHDTAPAAGPRSERADAVLPELLALMVAHLSPLPEPEAVGRVALTVRFLNSGLARWERDSQADVDDVAPLAPFTLILTDLAVAMLDAPSSVSPQLDAHLWHPHLAGHQALSARSGLFPGKPLCRRSPG
jgi:hypothetical protein